MSSNSSRSTPPFPIVTSAQRSVLAVAFASALVPVVAVVLRLVARRYTTRSFDAGDVCIIIACILAVALQGVIIAGEYSTRTTHSSRSVLTRGAMCRSL